MTPRIGTAGWSIPRAIAEQFVADGSALQRYASRLTCVEINSSFYRPHRQSTYARWAASVPEGFRFAVKMPKRVTHEKRLFDVAAELDRFLDETAGLGPARGPFLLQLPPSFAFEADRVAAFFAAVAKRADAPLVCEPRHASWFTAEAEALLVAYRVARVAADPARVPAAEEYGGWSGLRYRRLHGSPRVYYSAYGDDVLADIAASIAADIETWVIFDNTASGAAAGNATALMGLCCTAAAPVA